MVINFARGDGFEHSARSTGHGAKYPRKWEQVIAALLIYVTREQVAQAAGISSKTLQRMLKMPEFVYAYQQARLERNSQLLPPLLQTMPEAMATMVQCARDIDNTIPAAVKVRAARALLKLGGQATALEDLHLRVQKWEQQQRPPSVSAPSPRPVEITRSSPRGHGTTLGAKLAEAVNAVLTQPTVERAAQSLKIDAKKLQKCMRTPEFEQAYRQACWNKFSDATAQLQHLRLFCVSTLQQVMRNPKASASDRFGAAHTLWELGAETLAEVEELQLRLDRMMQPDGPVRGSTARDLRKAA